METLMFLLVACIGLIIGAAAGFFFRKRFAEGKIGAAEESSKKILAEAVKQAENVKKESQLQAKEDLYRAKADFERETRNKRQDLQKMEKRLAQKEEHLEKKVDLVDQKESALTRREKSLEVQEKSVKEMEGKYTHALDEQKRLLERVSGMTSEEAKRALMQSLENEAKHEAARTIRRIEEETRENADKIARNIIAAAIQRYSAELRRR